MSDLQIVLIVIGGLIIVAVLVLNWWQERQFHKQVESSFSDLQSDVLLDGFELDKPIHDKPILDDPALDVSKFYANEETLSNGDFSITNNVLEQTVETYLEDDRFIELPEQNANDSFAANISIDDAYQVLANKHKAEATTLQHDAASDPETRLEPVDNFIEKDKPTQHVEIKAIFNEVFNHTKAKDVEPAENVSHSTVRTTGQESQQSQDESALDLVLGNESKQDDATTKNEPILSLPAMLHAQMDLTAVLYLASESTLAEISKVVNGLFDGYDKPVHIHVVDEHKQWILLNTAAKNPNTDNQKVSRIACSLQLADRAGPVSRSVLNRFQLTVETLGLDINAHVEWQSSGDALTAANALDAFCIDVDKTMGFHLVHGDNGAFTGTKLRGLAEAQGLVLSDDGAFTYFDEVATNVVSTNSPSNGQLPSFVMFNREHNPFSPDMLRTSVVKSITFQLDIPRVKHCAEAFNHMVQVAKQMEIGLNARLVDDNNKPLGDIQIEKIRHQLKVIHATMLVRGIVPGSDSALRLFA